MASDRKPLPPIMTVHEVAEFLQVHNSTVYKLLNKHELPGFKLGADWRFSRERIERWCREKTEKQHPKVVDERED